MSFSFYWYDHLMAENTAKTKPYLEGFVDIVALFGASMLRSVPRGAMSSNCLVFVHAGSKKTDWDCVADASNNRYIVLVSSKPPLNSTTSGVYCIKHTLPKIAEVLRQNTNKVKSFIQSCEDKAPDWSLLELHSSSHLIALSILCQGYIAAHAELPDTTGQIKKSLERMGWDRVLPELQKKVKEKQKDVKEASWWQVFGDKAALLETIKSEWDEGWTDKSDVAQLVEMISSDTAIVNAEAVAKAYLQLSSKLSK